MKNKDIEELNDALWISYLAFHVDMTGHFTSLTGELQGNAKSITKASDNIKAFEVKLRLWDN
jgi:hypothetical protein